MAALCVDEFGCFWYEGVKENTLSLSSSLVKEREGTHYLYPSFSFTRKQPNTPDMNNARPYGKSILADRLGP